MINNVPGCNHNNAVIPIAARETSHFFFFLSGDEDV